MILSLGPFIMEAFELLSQCIRSGQLSAQQVTRELAEPGFRAWYLERHPEIIEAARRFKENDTVRVTVSGAFNSKLATVLSIGDSGVVVVRCAGPFSPHEGEYGFHPEELELVRRAA